MKTISLLLSVQKKLEGFLLDAKNNELKMVLKQSIYDINVLFSLIKKDKKNLILFEKNIVNTGNNIGKKGEIQVAKLLDAIRDYVKKHSREETD